MEWKCDFTPDHPGCRKAHLLARFDAAAWGRPVCLSHAGLQELRSPEGAIGGRRETLVFVAVVAHAGEIIAPVKM